MNKPNIKPKALRESLAVYSNKCLKCSHLVDGAKKAFVQCHFTKGNAECPAAEVRIVAVGQAVRYAKAVLKARTKRDLEKEAGLLNKVSLRSKEFQSRFYDVLKSLSGDT